MEGGGIEEGRQSDVSAYSRAKRKKCNTNYIVLFLHTMISFILRFCLVLLMSMLATLIYATVLRSS